MPTRSNAAEQEALRKELLKENLIRTAQHHRETCKGADCNISLCLLKELGEKAGLKFTREESHLFL
jgi:hypothetical protein